MADRIILGSIPGNPLHPTVIEIFVTGRHMDRYVGRQVDDPPGVTNAYYKDLWKVRKTLPKEQRDSRRTRIALVGCGKAKLAQPAKAGELYVGNLFVAAKAYARKHADGWFVLSAKYGLVGPAEVLEPYDMTMGAYDRELKEHWGKLVRNDLRRGGYWGNATLVFLAGSEYEGAVTGAPHVEKPMDGMMIGQRLRWLKENT